MPADVFLTYKGWPLALLAAAPDVEPRICDLELAKRLGYVRPADIRDLIKRLIREGKLNDSDIFRTVRKNGGRGRPSVEFWLTETQALKVIAKSETSVADAILDEMIEVYGMARRGLLPGQGVTTAQVAAIVDEKQAPLLEAIARQGEALERHGRVMEQVVSTLGAIARRLDAPHAPPPEAVAMVGSAGAAKIRGELNAYAALMDLDGTTAKSWRSKGEVDLRTHLAFAGTGNTWARLPMGLYGKAIAKLDEMHRSAKARLAPFEALRRHTSGPQMTIDELIRRGKN